MVQETLKRIGKPTPAYFKKLRMWALWIGGACTAISAYIQTINPESKVAVFLTTLSGAFTVIVPLLASLPIEDTSSDVEEKD